MGVVQLLAILFTFQILLCHRHVECYSSISAPCRVGSAKVDYSAASEYCEAHYRIKSYFGGNEKRDEVIYDARHGVLNTNSENLENARLDDCGFELRWSPTEVSDFSELDQIRKLYLPELRKLISQTIGGDIDDTKTTSSPILDIIFWHPMLRGNEQAMQVRSSKRPSGAPVASMVHMDTDCGAYGLDGILDLVEKNRLDPQPPCPFERDNFEKLLKDNGHRFLLLNIWRPVHPVQRSPLGILLVDYENSSSRYSDENNYKMPFFPSFTPSQKSSRWYTFSNMQPEECLLFKQFDRRIDKLSDLWHCALEIDPENNGESEAIEKFVPPRLSFDIKAMVILDEKVVPSMDRLLASTKPTLSLAESGEFCNAQSSRRSSRSW